MQAADDRTPLEQWSSCWPAIAAPLARLFRSFPARALGHHVGHGFMRWRCGMAYGRRRPVARERLVQRALRESGLRACDKECVRLDVPSACAVEPDMLRDTLRRTAGRRRLTLVHSETSTGVLQDVEALSSVVRDFDDVLLLVGRGSPRCGLSRGDGSLGRGGSTFVLTGSQIGGSRWPPGLAFWRRLRTDARAGPHPARTGLYFDS